MKKILLMCLFAIPAAHVFSQTLFTYGPYQVSKEEFLRAYNKNKTPVEDKEKSFREYLDLYSKFKLKVQAAKEMKVDTLEQMKFDLQNFRSQVEDGYATDDKATEGLVDEAIRRYQKDIHVLHFFVPLQQDTLKAYNALKEVKDQLSAGKTNYDEIIKEVSEKITAVRKADLGFITAMLLPYDIENLVYGLKPGETSTIFRTKSAIHVFKNLEERKSAGRWKVAQILFALPPDATQEKITATQKTADSIVTLAKKGTDFAELAKKFSDDKLTYLNGGEVPEFGTGKYDRTFEQQVFALKNDGDIAGPFLTKHGYHIVKRLQQNSLPADRSDENFVFNLKQQILKDTRSDRVKENFAKEVLKKTGYKRNPLVKDDLLFQYADSVAVNNEVKKYPINKQVIFSFAKSKVTGNDWLNFIKDYKLNPDVYKGETNKALLDKYIATASMEYYKKHLEEYNPDFNFQMQEFKEGNMLFEVMEKKVWGKAAADTTGLKKYYEAHRPNYLWTESADVLLFNCSDEKTAQAAADALKGGKDWRIIAEESDGKIQSDSSRYELTQLPVITGASLKEGIITAPFVNTTDNTASFVKILKTYAAGQQRSFEEAKGLVINEYQAHLEEEWIKELRKKYPVKVNEAVFQSLLK
ncbi:MAG: peptidylprolyl isomerase [Ferruginibacter sp.]